MATSYTSLLGFALPVTGELDGTWGDVVNDSITQLVEDSVAGVATASVTSGNWTLSVTGSGAANEARCAILIPTGTPGVSRNIIAPSQSKAYVVINQSDGAVVLKGSATSGTTIAANTKAICAWDGSDFVTVGTADVGNLSGTLPVSKGGTGATTLTANNVVLGNGTSAVQFVAPGNSGNVLTSNGTTWASSSPPTQVYPAAGIPNSTGTAWTTSYSTTGTGTVVALATSPSFTTPVLGTPTSGNLSNCTADGTNAVGYKNIPAVADKTTSYSLQTADVGKVVGVGTGGSIEIPNSTFAAGDAVLIFNNTTGNITITCTITTAYIAGTDSDKASVTLATRGVANILFVSGTVCVITGNVS